VRKKIIFHEKGDEIRAFDGTSLMMAFLSYCKYHVQSPNLRTPNPGFNPGFIPPFI
jgi:hypothetical protein